MSVATSCYSHCDEARLFEWLKAVPCVVQVQGRGRILHIIVDRAVTEEDLRELLALFNRYGIDMKQLAKLDRDEFKAWIRDERAYWHERVFGC